MRSLPLCCTHTPRVLPRPQAVTEAGPDPLHQQAPRRARGTPISILLFVHSIWTLTRHQNFPFSYANKKSFTLKYVGSATTFFLIPFIAVGYQL